MKIALSWAVLTDRTQCTRVNGHSSSIVLLISGVPQGSVLGPVLFFLYINDLTDIFPSSVFSKLFADDVKLYIHIDPDADVAVLLLLTVSLYWRNGLLHGS